MKHFRLIMFCALAAPIWGQTLVDWSQLKIPANAVFTGGLVTCTSTGASPCLQQQSGTFVISGNGNGLFQTLTDNIDHAAFVNAGASGVVNTSATGNTVTWVSGDQFQTFWPPSAGNTGTIVINSVTYIIATAPSATSLTLTTSPGNQSGVSYYYTGTIMQSVNNNYAVTGAGASVATLFNCTSTGTTPCAQQQAGTFVIYGNGNGLFQTLFANIDHPALVNTGATGTVNTSATGNTVTWVSGDEFQSFWPPSGNNPGTIVINSVPYTIATVPSMTSLTLTSSPGNQSGVSYYYTGIILQSVTGTYNLTGAGAINAQSFAATGGITVDNGVYGLSGSGVATVSACSGCTAVTYCLAAGTNTITCAGVPPPVSYPTGMVVTILIANTNSGATSVNINSLGAKGIFKNGSALSGGELVAGNSYSIQYDGTQFDLIPGASPAGTNTQVQYNSSGVFGASANFTFTGGNTLNVSSAMITADHTCTATGSSTCMNQTSNNFVITGAGAGTFTALIASASASGAIAAFTNSGASYAAQLTASGGGSAINLNQSGGAGGYLLTGTAASAHIFTLADSGGTCTMTGAAALSCTSDIRLKENIKPIAPSLKKLLGLTPIEYNMRGNGIAAAGLDAGKVKEVFPRAVRVDDNGYYQLSYTELVPYLIGAIKEQQAEIEALKRRPR